MIKKFWKKGLAKEVGCSLQPILRLMTAGDTSTPNWMKNTLGYTKLSEKYLKELSGLHGRTYTGGHMFVAFILEPSKFLPYLQRQFESVGGKMEIRKIEDLDALFKEGYEVVVNCTGLYSKQLADDPKMVAIRGQVTRVTAQWQYHVILDESDDGNYVIPK